LVIKTQNLSCTYSEGGPFEMHALRDVSVEIKKGEFVGIIGHTGSGKSTFVQTLNGLIKPTSGEIFINGENITEPKKNLTKIRTEVGLVFQYPEYQLFEETVYRDIAFAPKNMGLSKEEVEECVQYAVKMTGISPELMDKSPFELSGGQKRRVAIAGILAMKPSVLILDEPTAGLDPASRDEIIENIKKMHEETGTTVLMITHDMNAIAEIADRILVFNHGSLYMDGSVGEVFSRYDELEKIGLSSPAVTPIFKKLYNADVFTLAEAKSYLKGVLGNA